jgi:hypothetical protein
MKKLFTIVAAVLLTATLWAQSPEKMSYQAVIRNSSDALVTNTQVGMQISILQGSEIGTEVYIETQSPTTNANGLVSIEIGTGTVEYGDFATIDWANGPYFIKTETAIEAPLTTYTITGTSQLLSVPYAMHAKTAETVLGGGGGDGFTHYVGELYGGGIVVFVWKEGGVEHGLIASLTNVNTSAQWSSVTAAGIGTAAQSPIGGQANTTAMINQGDVSGAAYLCDNYSAGGFDDWYLPSVWELTQCYNAAFVVNSVLGNTNGFRVAMYWSSTESQEFGGWGYDFGYGSAADRSKADSGNVRAVRRF